MKRKNIISSKLTSGQILEPAVKYELLERVVNTIYESLVVLDSSLRVVWANKAFFDFFQIDDREVIGKQWYKLGNGQWDIPVLHKHLDMITSGTSHFEQFEMEHEFAGIGQKVLRFSARRTMLEGGVVNVLVMEDITQWKLIEQELRTSRDQ